MEKLNDEQLIKLLKAKCNEAYKEYTLSKNKLEEAELELNKCIAALNVWSKEQISFFGDNGMSRPTNDSKFNDKKEETLKLSPPLVYDSGATWKDKIVRVLKINNRAMSKDELARYIGIQEERTDIEKIKSKLTGELHSLIELKNLTLSKHRGIRMKGGFYGKPDWLLKEGEWKQEYEPKIIEKTLNLW